MTAATIHTDAVIVGAGPVGLFQAFQLGLQDIRSHIIDALPHVGGQCVELYADKPIYDIPGIPFCTGQELINRLQEQIKVLKTPSHFNQEVTGFAYKGKSISGVYVGNTFHTADVVVASADYAHVEQKLVKPD